MASKGRTDRADRVAQRKSGTWATSSQDLLYVAVRLFRLSRDEASARPDRNTSRFVYAGIPLLLAAAYSFAIEYEGIMNLGPVASELASDSLVSNMERRYGLTGDKLEELRDLVEIRNEIIHPVPLPSGTTDNWPHYLRTIKKKGLLNTTGNPNADYNLLAQIASHKLFAWAVQVTKELYAAVIHSNPAKMQAFLSFLDTFDLFK